MAGGYYIALSGMRSRLEALDRLATDLANASTIGYKAERGTTADTILAFKNKYGTNKNKANAFGKCVSQLAKAKSES